MPLDLSKTLVIGISATALFDMSESDRMFRETYETDPDSSIEKYRAYMLEHEDQPLQPGTGYPLVKALLGLNQYRQPGDQSPLVEVVVMSRNSPDTGIRVLNTIRHDGLKISRSAFTAGETVADYLDAFDVDLFLTTNVDDAQKVIDSHFCAAAVLKAPPSDTTDIPKDKYALLLMAMRYFFPTKANWSTKHREWLPFTLRKTRGGTNQWLKAHMPPC